MRPNPNPNPDPNPFNPKPNPPNPPTPDTLTMTTPCAGETLAGFNIVVGGGMGRAHKQEATFARAASHLGYVRKEMFFEAMKAILAPPIAPSLTLRGATL